MLSQLGSITLPTETLSKIYAGQIVSEQEQEQEQEQEIFDGHPSIGCKLLANIPRLGQSAEMIRWQYGCDDTDDADVILGRQMIQVAHQLDQLIIAGMSVKQALTKLRELGSYPLEVLDALAGFSADDQSLVIKSVAAKMLRAGMILNENVYSVDGAVIIGKDRELHVVQIERLGNFAHGVGPVEPIRVRVPV